MKRRLLAILLIASACHNERIDTRSIAQEMKDREIKHITSAQIVALADDWGKEIAGQLKASPKQSLLDNKLKDSLSKSFVANVEFLAPKNFEKEGLPELEKQVLSAYLYNISHKLPQSENIQQLPDEQTLLFTSPVIWNGQFSKLTKPEITALGQQYQLDSLQFRKDGDFLGVWAIKLTKKELIRRTDTKALKKLKNKVAE